MNERWLFVALGQPLDIGEGVWTFAKSDDGGISESATGARRAEVGGRMIM